MLMPLGSHGRHAFLPCNVWWSLAHPVMLHGPPLHAAQRVSSVCWMCFRVCCDAFTIPALPQMCAEYEELGECCELHACMHMCEQAGVGC